MDWGSVSMPGVGQGEDSSGCSSALGMSLGRAEPCCSLAIPAWQRQVQALSKTSQVGAGTTAGELYCSPGGDDKMNWGVSPVLHRVVQICHGF